MADGYVLTLMDLSEEELSNLVSSVIQKQIRGHKSYRKIAEELNVSHYFVMTVTRLLMYQEQKRKVLEEIKEEENLKEEEERRQIEKEESEQKEKLRAELRDRLKAKL